MASTKTDVLAEIQAEAGTWHTWQAELRAWAYRIQDAHGFCNRGNRDIEIPLETVNVNADHYTAEGLRHVVLKTRKAEHAQMKAAVRAYILPHIAADDGSGYVTAAELSEAF